MTQKPAIRRAVYIPLIIRGLSYADISRATGIPVGTIKSDIHRARRRNER